jgi:hypothetical protein
MDNIFRVQVHETFCSLHEITTSHALIEAPVFLGPQYLVQLSLRAELEEQKDSLGILKVSVQPQHIFVFQCALHLDLQFYLVHKIAIDDFVFPHALQGKNLVGAFASDFLHNTEGTFAKTFLSIQELEVIQTETIHFRVIAFRH